MTSKTPQKIIGETEEELARLSIEEIHGILKEVLEKLGFKYGILLLDHKKMSEKTLLFNFKLTPEGSEKAIRKLVAVWDNQKAKTVSSEILTTGRRFSEDTKQFT